MDAKITKKRLGLMLSYDWIKIIAICVAAVVLWSLIFTMTATKATMGQQFGVYGYPGVGIDTDHLGDLDDLHREGGLSFDVLDYTVSTYGSRNDAGTVLSAHIPAGSADVMFTNYIDTVDDKGDEDPSNDTVTQVNGYQNFLNGYRGYCAWLGDAGTQLSGVTYTSNYFLDCENYLKRFFGEDFLHAELDRAAAESNFRSRMKKDKRYKNEKQIQEGLEEEYARLNALRDAYRKVQGWMTDVTNGENGKPVLSVYTANVQITEESEGQEAQYENWTYGFDLSNVPNITYVLRNTERSGSAEGLCMSVINAGSTGEEDRRYEPFTFLAYIVELCMSRSAA